MKSNNFRKNHPFSIDFLEKASWMTLTLCGIALIFRDIAYDAGYVILGFIMPFLFLVFLGLYLAESKCFKRFQ